MPKTKSKKVVTRQKDTRKTSSSGVRVTRQESSASGRPQPSPITSRKRGRGNTASNQQSNATPMSSVQSPSPRTRQENGGGSSRSSHTARRQETRGAPSPKRRRQEQSRSLTEEDIPRIIDAYVRSWRRHHATLDKSDEEFTDVDDSDSSETTLGDEELSGKGVKLHIVGM